MLLALAFTVSCEKDQLTDCPTILPGDIVICDVPAVNNGYIETTYDSIFQANFTPCEFYNKRRNACEYYSAGNPWSFYKK